MSNDELKDYKKKIKLYEKILDLWPQVYGTEVQTAGNDGPGTNPPPKPPPPPGS
jgi:hypothetical protein